jgi:hypothetical protein
LSELHFRNKMGKNQKIKSKNKIDKKIKKYKKMLKTDSMKIYKKFNHWRSSPPTSDWPYLCPCIGRGQEHRRSASGQISRGRGGRRAA